MTFNFQFYENVVLDAIMVDAIMVDAIMVDAIKMPYVEQNVLSLLRLCTLMLLRGYTQM